MYKILYLNSSNELYGADRSLLRLVKALDRERYEPFVVLPNDLPYEGYLANELKLADVDYQEIQLGVLRRKYSTPLGIFKLLVRIISSSNYLAKYSRENSINLIHSNTAAVLSGAGLSRMVQVPHIWHMREIITNPLWLKHAIAFLLHHFADTIIAVSGPVKDSLLAVDPKLADKVEIVHNGIDPSPYNNIDNWIINDLRRSWGISDEDIIIGMIGRISPGKGQVYLVKACAQILKSRTDVRLVIVGGSIPGNSDHRDNLTNLIAAYGLQDRIILEDFRTEIGPILSAFDIFVLPSIHPEAFPTAVLEAMAAGKPVIATAHGGATEQIINDVTGILVSPSDESEMTLAVQSLIDNARLRQEIGIAGREFLLNNFTLDRYINKIEKIYQRIL